MRAVIRSERLRSSPTSAGISAPAGAASANAFSTGQWGLLAAKSARVDER